MINVLPCKRIVGHFSKGGRPSFYTLRGWLATLSKGVGESNHPIGFGDEGWSVIPFPVNFWDSCTTNSGDM
jgi:hypothetical protein